MSGSTPENSIGTAMDAAEARVNRGKEDIGTSRNPDGTYFNKKAEIKTLEASVKKAVEGYKQMGIYEDVRGSFVKLQLSSTSTPEKLLADMAANFDRTAAAESAEAGAALNVLAVKTYNDLNTLKKDLGYVAGQEIKLQQTVEASHQARLPEYRFDPSNIAESVKGMGELLGNSPNAAKLQGYEVENDTMLSELRLSKNTSRYYAANTEFRYLAGCGLEEVKGKAAASLQKVYETARVNGVTSDTMGQFTRAFAAALDLFKITNAVESKALFSEEHATAEEESEHAENGHGDYLSEDEMQVMLGIMMNGVEDKTYLEQLFDAKTALDSYAGHEVDLNTLSPVQRQVFALTNGIGTGAATTIGFFVHPVEALHHIASAGKALLKGSTYTKLYQMTNYTWEHTSALEKNMLMGDLVGQFLGGAGVGGALSLVLKSGTLGAVGTKLSRVARVTGVVGAAEAISVAVNPALRAFPTLARYGSDAAEIAANWAGDAKTIAHKWDHFAHKAHQVHEVIDYAEVATVNTAGTAHTAHDVAEKAALPTTLPIYAETAKLKEDYKVAQTNAGKLGLSANDIYTMQAAFRTLDEASKG